MEIKVLGPGCKKCEVLEGSVRRVVEEMGIDATIEKITDMNEILDAGVMMAPGLIINGKVKLTGKLASKAEIKQFITEEA